MDEEQLVQMLELSDGEIRGASGLHALPASDSDTYMCLADHAAVVRSVADRQRDTRRMSHAHQSHDISFLFGRDAASDDHFHLVGCHQEQL